MAFARSASRNDDDATLRRRLFSKLGQVLVQVPFAEDLLTAYYCAFDRGTPSHVKAALVAAIAYFILPFDAIPDMLPVLGFTDDAAVLAAAMNLMMSHIQPEHRSAAKTKLAEMARS